MPSLSWRPWAGIGAAANPLILAAAGVFAGCGGETSVENKTVEEWSGAPAESEAGSETKKFAIETEGYAAGLAAHVDERGMVDYAAWKAGRAGFDSYIESIARLDYAALRARPDAEQLVFWFNAYNAITIKYILDNHPIEKGGIISGALYPAKSVRQIKGVWDSLTTLVAGRELTLDEIEHEILRAQFYEPRLHMALVCASLSCPPLRTKVFAADRLDEQLDDQARIFLSGTGAFQIDRERGRIGLSAIFDWYGGDFVKGFGSPKSLSGHNETETAVLHFVRQYVSEEDAAYIDEAEYSLRYLDYDWTLNEQ